MAKSPAKPAVRLEPSSLSLLVDLSSPADLKLIHPSKEDVVSAVWKFLDADQKSVTLPAIDAKKPPNYKGVRANTSEFGVRLYSGTKPSYSVIDVEGKVKLKHEDTGDVRDVTVKAHAGFGHAWGGVAKQWWPYPADWDIPWTKDRKGQRALVLMHDLISRLPDEIRRNAGSMPIVRTVSPGAPFANSGLVGAHWPFWHDAVQIADKIVQDLSDSAPDVQPADIEFSSTVLHEITHAITYKKAMWDLHQSYAGIRKFLRNPGAGWPGVPGAVVAAVPVVLLALLKELVSPPDFVSGYAEAADWELSNPWARAARLLHPSHDLFDFFNWLGRIPSQGLVQDAPLRPNLATGFGGMGKPLGLRHRSGVERTTLLELQSRIFALPQEIRKLEAAYDAAVAAGDAKKIEIAKERLEKARQELIDKRKELAKAQSRSGLVSDYAAEDVLEDIAETYCHLVFGSAQLNKAPGRIYADLKSANGPMARRREYLQKEGVYPTSWPAGPLRIGELYKGLEAAPHLENWFVEL